MAEEAKVKEVSEEEARRELLKRRTDEHKGKFVKAEQHVNKAYDKETSAGIYIHGTSTENEKQLFNRIKSVRAEGGHVIVDVKKGFDPSYKGRPLTTQVWTVKEAAARAKGLNELSKDLSTNEALIAMEIVTEVIAKCKEAQQQLFDPNIKSKIKKETVDPSTVSLKKPGFTEERTQKV